MAIEVFSSYGKRPNIYLGVGNERFLILGTSGSGKSIFTNDFVYELKQQGYKVVYLTEKPGGAFENAFMAFEPEASWHRKLLKLQGSKFDMQQVELLLPFSISKFSMKESYPECFKPYSVALKDIRRESWGCLLNKDAGSETVSLCYNVAQKCNPEDTVFDFGRKLFKSVSSTSGNKVSGDFVGLGLPVSESGDSDSVKRISSAFSELVDKHFLIGSSRDSLLLNWVGLTKILTITFSFSEKAFFTKVIILAPFLIQMLHH